MNITASGPPLTVHDCAAAANVSPMTIYRLVETGVLPSRKIGRSIRIDRADWLAYWEGTKHG